MLLINGRWCSPRAEIWDMLQKVELMLNIVWVHVILHDETQIEEENEREKLILAEDSIVIWTNMQPSELEKSSIVNGYVLMVSLK